MSLRGPERHAPPGFCFGNVDRPTQACTCEFPCGILVTFPSLPVSKDSWAKVY